jgi:hypothetical protein
VIPIYLKNEILPMFFGFNLSTLKWL